MKDQIIISKHNAECAIAIPLYRRNYADIDAGGGGFVSIMAYSESEKPVAYAIDFGKRIHLFNADMLEKQVIFAGDL